MLIDYYAYGLERKLILYCFMHMYAIHKHAQIHPHSNIFTITHTYLCIRNKQNLNFWGVVYEYLFFFSSLQNMQLKMKIGKLYSSMNTCKPIFFKVFGIKKFNIKKKLETKISKDHLNREI